MSKGFPMLPQAARAIERLRAAGHEAWIVGGCVRDVLLGRTPTDYDLTTSALPEETEAVFAGERLIETGLQHGTVTVLLEGVPLEITTYRVDGGYTDARHPDGVTFTRSLREDAARRDFTINAMAWDEDGLADRFGGQADLDAGLIRCVGEPERRFQEDALRILRGLRLAAQLDFAIHPDTAQAIRTETPRLAMVARERIGVEFLRLLCGPGAGRVLLDFPQTVCEIVPQLVPTVGFDQKNPHHAWDVYTHLVKTVEKVPPEPALRLAALLHDVGKPATFFMDEGGTGHFYGHAEESARLCEDVAGQLRLDSATRNRVVTLVQRHHLPLQPTQACVGRWLRRLGPELFFQLIDLMKADAASCLPGQPPRPELDQAADLARTILAQAPCLTLKDLAVNGRDAMVAGLSGPAIGRALNRLLDQVAEGILPNDRDILLEHLTD